MPDIWALPQYSIHFWLAIRDEDPGESTPRRIGRMWKPCEAPILKCQKPRCMIVDGPGI
jgi:hypothetical protein